ncbi:MULTISPECIES: AAA family ATPase [Sphingobacteriaceae]|nr:AAA family ATPase [Sphingobacterium spiritivorum]QQS98064.1 AAA family ATPase [Sphingobacterium spiritivorum]
MHQIRRLKESLEKDGFTKEAKSLQALLVASESALDMAPSKIQRSFVVLKGEELTTKTSIPVDKETSTPLAEIFFPDNLPETAPMFDDNIQLAIQSIVNEWRKFDQLMEINATPASSCLIYGAPGTGKTHLAKWIAKQIGLPVVLARLEGLMSSYLGTTSRNIGNLFAFANRYKCILLLDEFDAIAKLRNDPQEVGEVKRVVNTLLQSLDSRHEKGFTIGVTNHESLLDPAIWRRFDIQVEIPKPSPEVMIQLLNSFIKPLEFNESEIKFLAWCLDGSSGADAEMLSKWLKRAFVLEKKSNIVEVMKQFALLNSGRVDTKKRNIMLHSDEDFINMLLNDKVYFFKQKDIASLFGMTPSTLSKQLSKFKDSEKI